MPYRDNAWRRKLIPAYFRNMRMGGTEGMFHVEVGTKESGRRIVTHEFPKKEYPYSEDMGRRAIEFTVRGYIIAYPTGGVGSQGSSEPLLQEDYTIARDILMNHLDAEGPGVLQLPNGHGALQPMKVVCQRYRMAEEQRLGGYCTFDMSFVELGAPPFREVSNAREGLVAASQQLAQRVEQQLAQIGAMQQNPALSMRLTPNLTRVITRQ